MKNWRGYGYLLAMITVFIWGTTFISSKVVLEVCSPAQNLFVRFLIGLAALLVIKPKILPFRSWKQEAVFAFAGLTGVSLYYYCENLALTYTYAANVSVIVSSAPVFTVLLAAFLNRNIKIKAGFWAGFVLAMVGIGLISLNGTRLQLNPAGDLIALFAAMLWAFYTQAVERINAMDISLVQATQRIFFYGLLFMIPVLFFEPAVWNLDVFFRPEIFWNTLYLGIGASALCFLTWNKAVALLGTIKTSVYIYLVPLITMAGSALLLAERITLMAIAGMVMILAGLFLSEKFS